MITSQDRAGWFGASDTQYILGNWATPSFARWWLVKLGVLKSTFTSPAMRAGTHYEHRILDALGIEQRDRQIKIPRLLLRVNLDGETFDTVKEVKTYGSEVFRVSKAYWQQNQVQQFAAEKWGEVVAYKVGAEEYSNYFLPIDPRRLSFHPIAYDPRWVDFEYLPRLEYLAYCLRKGLTPCAHSFSNRRT